MYRTFAAVCALLSLALPIRAAAQKPQPLATILGYHIVASPQDTKFSIPQEVFERQMNYLATAGYNVIRLSDLSDFMAGKRKSLPRNAVVITVDDGWRCAYTHIYPVLKEHKFPFTVFIYPKFIGQSSYALTWKQVREMASDGVDIQSHSLSHPFLTHRRHTSLGSDAYLQWLTDELKESKEKIEAETGKDVRFLAYPYGDYDSMVAEMAAKAGYRAALTCDFGPVTNATNPYRLKRVIMYEDTSFVRFRHSLGTGELALAEKSPTPGKIYDPSSPVVSARIQNFKSLEPTSVGMALLSLGRTPYSYNPGDGSISLVVRDELKGQRQTAVVWGTDQKSGKRVEALWAFYLTAPEPEPPPVAVQRPAGIVGGKAASGTSAKLNAPLKPIAGVSPGGLPRR